MLKKFVTVRFVLSICLFFSVLFAGYSIYYKIKYWGFNFAPKQTTDVWTIEAHISFEPTGDPIKISMATPTVSDEYKILDEDAVAPGYKINKDRKNNRVVLSSSPKEGTQNIYYRILVFDNEYGKGKIRSPIRPEVEKPIFDEQRLTVAQELLKLSDKQEGDDVQRIIRLLNQTPPDPTVLAFMPMKKSQKEITEAVSSLLALKNIPTRTARGIKLEEDKKSFTPDLMLEAYMNGRWILYNIQTGKKGLPENFVIFQRGGVSLLDVEGGSDSVIKFTVLKSISSSLSLAGPRAKLAEMKNWYDNSIYSLPLMEQNTLKWLMIFPLAILIIVLMRNVVGVVTMGTFTPMLISMSLIKTGFLPGLVCFGIIITLGLILRAVLSKLNLLLVPRISAVVIFVILIMQGLMIMGYRMKFDVASSAAFFPIIIMAWIIERASITWEEDGPVNATREIIFTVLVAIITYFVISSEYIRHIMFAFNELNLVILFIVMLLGTYTGYRLTELRRFAPLVQKKGK